MARYGYIPNFRSKALERQNELTKRYGLTKDITKTASSAAEAEDNLIAWISYFRANPARFAVEYLGIRMLSHYQRYTLHTMFMSSNVVWIASRGAGKTFLSWLYCIIRCILYPGTQIVFTSTTLQQAVRLMKQKVDEFRSDYPNINSEILAMHTSENPGIEFHNGSRIWIAPPSTNALGFRANCIVIDEYRQVDDTIIRSVFVKFLTSVRKPPFMLRKDENGNPLFKHEPEKNIEIYISSQAPTYEVAYTRYTNSIENMLTMNGYLSLCTPYYIGVRDGIITKDKVLSELHEAGADLSIFALEYECIPFGSNDNAYFTNEMFTNNRVLQKPFIPMTSDKYLESKGVLSKNPFYMKKEEGELRLLGVDTALAGNSDSANTIAHLIRLIPREITKKTQLAGVTSEHITRYYEKQVVYTKNITGDMNPHVQAKIIKRLFHLFETDNIVIDAHGASLGIVYALVLPTYDEEYNVTYQAYDCINDEKVSAYCKEPEHERLKVMYGIKNAGVGAYDLQHRYNTYTRDELLGRRLKFLTLANQGESYLSLHQEYELQTAETQAEWISAYKQCDALVAEAVSLEKVMRDGGTKVTLEMPKRSLVKRRDRIIALQYALLRAQELEIENLSYQTTFDYTKYSNSSPRVSPNRRMTNPFGSSGLNKLSGFGWRR